MPLLSIFSHTQIVLRNRNMCKLSHGLLIIHLTILNMLLCRTRKRGSVKCRRRMVNPRRRISSSRVLNLRQWSSLFFSRSQSHFPWINCKNPPFWRVVLVAWDVSNVTPGSLFSNPGQWFVQMANVVYQLSFTLMEIRSAMNYDGYMCFFAK